MLEEYSLLLMYEHQTRRESWILLVDGIGDDTINSFNQHINNANNSKDQNSIVNNTETLREINTQVIQPPQFIEEWY